MRYVLAGVAVVAAFILGRVSADWSGPQNAAETSDAMAAMSGSQSGGMSILDLDDTPARPLSITEQVEMAQRRNESGLEARLQRAQVEADRLTGVRQRLHVGSGCASPALAFLQ